MRAAVVGAGLAGLTAAYELGQAGAEVVVLEARRRVGGRVWSRRLDNGAVVEMGAEFLLPGNTAVRELAAEFGLGLCDKGMSYGRREPRGADTDADELQAAAAAVEAALDALASRPPAERPRGSGGVSPRTVSARSFLEALDIPGGARAALIARVEISSANSADLVAARDLTGLAHVDDDPAPSIVGGNQGLALALAAALGAAVHLDAPVGRVAWGEDGVRLSAGGGELEADVCVIAVPAGVLDRIAFDPPLPAKVIGPLHAVDYGHAAKLFVPLAGSPPPSAVMSVPERYWCWTATGPNGAVQPVVSCFAGSAAALAALGVERGPERWLESLGRLRPDLELDPGGAVLSTWTDDPWVRGAYSTSPPMALADELAAPIGPLAFAGEHLGGEFAALMEGAVRSGRRAAATLIAVRARP